MENNDYDFLPDEETRRELERRMREAKELFHSLGLKSFDEWREQRDAEDRKNFLASWGD